METEMQMKPTDTAPPTDAPPHNHAHSAAHGHAHSHGHECTHVHAQAEVLPAAQATPEVHTHTHQHEDGETHAHAHVRSHSWGRFFWERLRRFVLLMSLVAIGAFTIAAVSPVDPVSALVKAEVLRLSPEQREQISAKWGLNDPAHVRFGKWASRAVQGDLGRSMIYDAPVSQVIAERFKASLSLMALAWCLAGALGFALGLLAGALEGSLIDRCIRGYAMVLASAPTFWVAIVLLMVFAVHLGWAPVCCASPPGYLPEEVSWTQRLHHLALPVLALSMLGVAQVTLHTREKCAKCSPATTPHWPRRKALRAGGVPGGMACAMAHCPRLPCTSRTRASCLAARCWLKRCFLTPGWATPRWKQAPEAMWR